jgi:hypothetical protein
MLSKKAPIIVLALAIVGALAAALANPALARSSDWKPESVECQSDTQTIVVTGEVSGGSPSSDHIYYNGRLVYTKTVNTAEAGNGKFAYSLKGRYIRLGGEVRIVNTDSGKTLENTCYNAVPINEGHGDHWASLYNDVTDSGDPSVKVYCIVGGQGQYGGQFSKAELKAIPRNPDANVTIKTITSCAAPIGVYLLTTGEYQVNIGPDGEGKTAVIIFRRMPPIDIYFRDIDPNLPAWY